MNKRWIDFSSGSCPRNEEKGYRSRVWYACVMCDEIFSHVVGVVSGYTTNPGKAVKWVLWYLEAQMGKGRALTKLLSRWRFLGYDNQ